jgi:hypothetical protein
MPGLFTGPLCAGAPCTASGSNRAFRDNSIDPGGSHGNSAIDGQRPPRAARWAADLIPRLRSRYDFALAAFPPVPSPAQPFYDNQYRGVLPMTTYTALITGSTSGIGLGIARAFAAQGHNIVLNGFGDRAAIEQLRGEMESEFQIRAVYDGADMTRPEEIERMVLAAIETFGGVDILVNNAGIQHVAPIEEFPVDKWNIAIFRANLPYLESCRLDFCDDLD